MYQVVLDTNVLVAALRSKYGASHRLLGLLGHRHWRPNVTVPIVLEYEAVLKRHCREFGLSEEEIDDVIDALCSQAGLHRLYFLWRPAASDPDDDLVLEPRSPATATSSSPLMDETFPTAGDSEFGV